MNSFAEEIMKQKYSHIKEDGTKETWDEIADRVVKNVMSVLKVSKDIKQQTFEFIRDLKFIPGGIKVLQVKPIVSW